MNLKDLYYFEALKELSSYTAVAKKFGISQPSVSYAIKRLEENFNCQLVEHDPSHRTFHLTPQGEILYRHLERILPELRATRKAIDRSLSHHVTVGFPPIIVHYLLRSMQSKSAELDFLSHIRPVRGGSLELLDLLFTGDLDASLIGHIAPLEAPNLCSQPLFQKQLDIVLSKHHPLAKKDFLSFEDLLDESFILLDENFVHLKAFEQLNDRYHQQANIFFKTDDVMILKELLKKEVGISLLADMALDSNDNELVAIPLDPKDRITFTISSAHLKTNPLTGEIRSLFSWLKEAYDQRQ
ncbi:LysR family transcriptional regulator [Streptococcus sp. DD13]|uniref:LysR family transcriptional regulator n=1 Tax=Streptococcus sp. DD13 TaxID=1777881 RepID=UPI000794E796|nr:LysR family transcriptional regulator [Streptococcus sp. DD13]KXT77849.1 Malolactic regulator [Streptococcus sp. DD13]